MGSTAFAGANPAVREDNLYASATTARFCNASPAKKLA